MANRIAHLDGHRGLAILLVILFHTYTRWSDIVPYGTKYKYLFDFGWLGVQLFFMISGFVILMTLEKCQGIREFLFRRWLRLFPAMFFCSLLIYASSTFLYERPQGEPVLSSIIPGIFFIEPYWLKKIFGFSAPLIEGAFWSIFVEFKFYLFAGLIFFIGGRTCLVISLITANLAANLFKTASDHFVSPLIEIANSLCWALSFEHFSWFATGAAFYIAVKTKNKSWIFSAVTLAIYSSISVRPGEWQLTVIAFFLSALFGLSFISISLQKILTNRFFQFFGFVSYPLYLIHENAIISLTIKMGKTTLMMPDFLYPLLPIILLSIIAYIIAQYNEPFLKRLMLTITRPLRA